MKPSDLLGEMGSGAAGQQAWVAGREAGWEATVTRKISRALGVAPKDLLAAARQASDTGAVNLAALELARPDLTLRFAARRLPGSRFGDIDEMTERGFTKSLLYQAYQEALAQWPGDERTLVLVIPWAYAGTKAFYCCGGRLDLTETGAGRFWITKGGCYVLDELPRLLKILKRET